MLLKNIGHHPLKLKAIYKPAIEKEGEEHQSKRYSELLRKPKRRQDFIQAFAFKNFFSEILKWGLQ